MSDDLDLIKMGTHAATGIGGGGVVAAVMRWLQGREAEKAREEFVLLRAAVERLIQDVGEHKKVFEDVVETKLSLRALHARMDDVASRVKRLEERKR